MSPEDINSQQEGKDIIISNLNDHFSSDSSDEFFEVLDEEALAYHGYEMLPSVNLENNDSYSESNESDNETESNEISSSLEQCIIQMLNVNEFSDCGSQTNFTDSIPDTTQIDVWNQPSKNDIELTSEKLQTIEQCMANIKLDCIKTPDWAKNIPESEWKENIWKRLILK